MSSLALRSADADISGFPEMFPGQEQITILVEAITEAAAEGSPAELKSLALGLAFVCDSVSA